MHVYMTAWVYTFMNAYNSAPDGRQVDHQITPKNLCRAYMSASRRLPSPSTIAIYYYYSAQKAYVHFTLWQRVEGCVVWLYPVVDVGGHQD